MSQIIIRQAREEDGRQILDYLKRVGGETDNLTFGAEGLPITEEEERLHIRAVGEDPRSVLYVAVKDGEIIGDASLSAMPRRMSHRGEVGLSVVKAEWNRGIGSALLEKVIDYARRCGTQILNLEVREDNLGAIHLYEKFGFQKIGVSPAFFRLGEEYVDFLLMYLDLREKNNCTEMGKDRAV